MSVTVYHGDSRDVLKTLPDNSIDSCVCDPPYALVSIQKRLGKPGSAPVKFGTDGAYARAAKGFMGQQWDTGETAFDPAFWVEVMRVLKPGGYLLAFGGTRTYHRLACAIEDAGFEIRDQIGWLFGSGFPKSHDVSKAIDRRNGDEREVLSEGKAVKRMIPGADQAKAGWEKTNGREFVPTETKAASAASAAWEGWGSALKPAWEPVVMARKALIGTIAENVLTHGTGAINIDGCRVATTDDLRAGAGNIPMRHDPAVPRGRTGEDSADRRYTEAGVTPFSMTPGPRGGDEKGRFPANVIHDGSGEVFDAFPVAPGQQRAVGPEHGAKASVHTFGDYGPRDTFAPRGDSGSAARFFYSAKADKEDRLGSKHPTVKPVDLMAYLCRLVTPPGGTVLDPFAGSGSTGMACLREGFDAVLIEREAQFVEDIKRRIAHVSGEDAPLFAAGAA